jgi:hypothetical protein
MGMSDIPRTQDGDFMNADVWAALERGIAADARLREALAASGADLRGEAITLLAHLQAVRDRLLALRKAADTTARLAAAAKDSGSHV